MQNLIVNNDKKSEYVQFTVNLPDGYDKFKVDGINGSIINQNYLNVGDTITFKFDNNPIRYDKCKLKIRLNCYNEATSQKQYWDDDADYKFVQADLFKIYQLVYIPIYTVFDQYDGSKFYVFNPCDSTQLLKEPSNDVPNYPIDPDAEPAITMDFTGKFVLGLIPTPNNKLPDINITIGESISNSRMQPNDIGSFQIQNSTVNEVATSSLISTAYNYGATWIYPISHLMMNAKRSIRIEAPQADVTTRSYIAAFYDLNTGRWYTKNHQFNQRFIAPTNGIISQRMYFKWYDSNQNPTISDISVDTYIERSVKYPVNDMGIVQKTGSNPDTYSLILATVENPYTYFKGSDIDSSNLYKIATNGTVTPITTSNHTYIEGDWYYTLNPLMCKIVLYTGDTPLANKTFNIPNQDSTHIGTLYTFDRNNSVNLVDTNGDTYKVYFSYLNSNTNKWSRSTNNQSQRKKYRLCGTITTDENGVFVIGYRLDYGLYQNINTWPVNNSTFYNTPCIQLTNSDINDTLMYTNNDEDIYVKAVEDTKTHEYGLNISYTELTNDYSLITYGNNNDISSVRIKGFKWFYNYDESPDMANDKLLLAYIPLNNCNTLTPLVWDNYPKGFFKILTKDGDVPTSLDDELQVNIEYGHETLNIEGIRDDDDVFKTFNGSLLLDRSDSRITRMLSNDTTGLALGYINDLLAAKLSKYYFIASTNVFNTFFDTTETITISKDINMLNNIYRRLDPYTGDHSTTLCSCYDLVKLIGSENLTYNCIPGLCVENQQIRCDISTRNEFNDETYEANEIKIHNYYLMHYYNSGIDMYPNTNIDEGLPTIGINHFKLFFNTKVGIDYANGYNIVYNTTPTHANLNPVIYGQCTTMPYPTNNYLSDYDILQLLPAFRIYKNNNFDQSDLTITTGGVKTLHPVYIQSTPKVLLNNILYMLDYAVSSMLSRYGNTNDMFLSLNTPRRINPNISPESPSLIDAVMRDKKYPVSRFATKQYTIGGKNVWIASSFDSYFILNYINTLSINNYDDITDMGNSIPTKSNVTSSKNIELIRDINTQHQNTNVQLFSTKYFNFYDNVDIFAMVTFKQQYVEYVYYTDRILKNFYNIEKLDDEALAVIKNMLSTYINNQNIYNNLKNCKLFLCKLGEFMQYPRILFGVASQVYNNSLSVAVHNFTMTDYETPLNTNYDLRDGVYYEITESNPKPEQKINTYYSGVVFKYHQLALGYQNLSNELYDEFVISRSKGNRNIVIVLVDEYGRRIPNEDTSQGFKNNLYLELTLSTNPPAAMQQPQQ